jgi:hypothetical protein
VIRTLSIFAVLVAAACNRSADGPACGAVGSKFMLLAKDDLEHKGADEATRRAIEAQLPAMRDSIAHVCTDAKWSAAVRKCLVDANDRVAFESCEQQLTDAQRQALDRAARGEDTETDSK